MSTEIATPGPGKGREVVEHQHTKSMQELIAIFYAVVGLLVKQQVAIPSVLFNILCPRITNPHPGYNNCSRRCQIQEKTHGSHGLFLPYENKQQSVSWSIPEYKIIMIETYDNHASRNTQL